VLALQVLMKKYRPEKYMKAVFAVATAAMLVPMVLAFDTTKDPSELPAATVAWIPATAVPEALPPFADECSSALLLLGKSWQVGRGEGGSMLCQLASWCCEGQPWRPSCVRNNTSMMSSLLHCCQRMREH
jgi:peptidoglycan/LPS O-acetylase OafA/YrhL